MTQASLGGDWEATGYHSEIAGSFDRTPEYDPINAEHLWSWTVLFRANPSAEQAFLDSENLLCIAGVNCFYCERQYTPELSHVRCAGQPD